MAGIDNHTPEVLHNGLVLMKTTVYHYIYNYIYRYTLSHTSGIDAWGTTLAEDRNNALLPAKTKPNSGVARVAKQRHLRN
jgi:hypothetical protein